MKAQQCITAIYSRLFIIYGVRQSLRSCRRIRLRPNPCLPAGRHSELLKPVLNRNVLLYQPETDGYMRPLATIKTELCYSFSDLC